jgi:hypothetical protein
LRDVVRNSAAFAREEGNSRLQLSVTSLSSIETKRQVPTLHHLYTLARVHGLVLERVLMWYLATPSSVGSQAK